MSCMFLRQGYAAVIGRLPVFISGVDANETFNAGHGITDCDACYDAPNRTKLWGLATSAVYWTALYNSPNSIKQLDNKAYRFNLLSTVNNVTQSISNSTPGSSIGNTTDMNCNVCAGMPRNPVSASLTIYNQVWVLQLEPQNGWEPTWKAPVIAAIVIVSVLLALLVFVMMVSLKQQARLLKVVTRTNGDLADKTQALQDEKVCTYLICVTTSNAIRLTLHSKSLRHSYNRI